MSSYKDYYGDEIYDLRSERTKKKNIRDKKKKEKDKRKRQKEFNTYW